MLLPRWIYILLTKFYFYSEYTRDTNVDSYRKTKRNSRYYIDRDSLYKQKQNKVQKVKTKWEKNVWFLSK